MSRDLSAEPRSIFDSILEPLPPGVERVRSSLSEELYKSATWDTSIDLLRFGDHRDTFALFSLRHLQSRRIELPTMFWERLLYHIDYETYLSIRLSCRCWSKAITRVCSVTSRPFCQLPTEILDKIYRHLDPVDFNAARRICRTWMVASLEEKLLMLMLGRGGWRSAADADASLQGELNQHNMSEDINQEWILSKRLTTECSLRPDWTGNGLPKGLFSDEQHRPTSLHLTSTTDFSELSNDFGPMDNGQLVSTLHFTVSACNKFVLVTEGCVIYIYSIQDSASAVHHHGGYLSPLTTVICPHRVLAVSMDTSAQRFAVAALLEGRVGIVCDISDSTIGSERLSGPRALPTAIRDGKIALYNSPQSSSDQTKTEVNSPNEYARYEVANDRATARAIAEATLPEIHGARATRQSWTMDDPLSTSISRSRSFQDNDVPMDATSHVPIADGARSVYRSLCSAEDPPRSVAICPQRRCIAFGCAAGIELHWIDALTGQDLNRWFPLTAPSDFLYFLPPRPGVDSAKKLRLISSAGHPKQKDGLLGRFFPNSANDGNRYQSMTWDETSDGIGLLRDSAWRGIGWCEHFRAVPISDGGNILFTDPEEGLLCLGSDAPPGARASKLMRRFMFVGPTGDDGKPIVPSVYASGGELRWGVRVVVGFQEALWLFVIPPDVYSMDKGSGKEISEPAGVDEVAPTFIQGLEIGKVPALVDIAVDATGGDLTIWSFAADGMAYVWQIGSKDRAEPHRLVLRDGTLGSNLDAEGDTFMHKLSGPAVHFDGNASTPLFPQHMFERDRVVDTDGDVAMAGMDEDEGYSSEFDAAGGTFAIHAPPLWGRWSEDDADWVPDYLAPRGNDIEDEGLGVDVLEMSRIDVEVWCG